jgi:hypothetical protein
MMKMLPTENRPPCIVFLRFSIGNKNFYSRIGGITNTGIFCHCFVLLSGIYVNSYFESTGTYRRSVAKSKQA